MTERDPDAERPGRNDPCWCGSGTKYKKCHLDADEDARRARVAKAGAAARALEKKEEAAAAAKTNAAKPAKGGALVRRGFEGPGATNKRNHKKTRK